MTEYDVGQKALTYFQEISLIPRPSYHEQHIADYLMAFAASHGLRAYRDDMHNVIIYAEASSGYEDHPVVMLQGHTDIVADKEPESSHCFETDPLDVYIEDGFLKARQTTLGGDDGIAVAYMLAILDTPEIKHPPLECVFTVQEEAGLFGAYGLDAAHLKAARMISLDEMTFGTTTISTCGGCDVFLKKRLTRVENYDQAYTLVVKGLAGGHSGEHINKGKDNAIVHIVRLMKAVVDAHIPFKIISFQGGSKGNAIPRSASLTFASNASPYDIAKTIKKTDNLIKEEYAETETDIVTTLHNCEAFHAYSEQESQDLINMLFILPNGLITLSQTIKDLPVTSLNQGVLTFNDDVFTLHLTLRSVLQSGRDYLAGKIAVIASLYHCEFERSHDYCGWAYDLSSPLRAVMKKTFEDYFHFPLKEIAEHGGLETGAFKEKLPGLDIVTLGCHVYDYHTPQERVEIDSFLNTARFLAHLLSKL